MSDTGADTEFATGMGIAIGAFIALFTVAIALFLFAPEQPHGATTPRTGARAGGAAIVPTAPISPAAASLQ